MSDPILLLLTVDATALLLLSVCVTRLPVRASGFVASALCGLGALLCLPPLLLRLRPTELTLPAGPPGLSFHLALDPLSLFFLLTLLLAGTALSAFQAIVLRQDQAPLLRATTTCLGGAIVCLLGADGVILSLGLAVTCAAHRLRGTLIITSLLALAAVCLLTPAGYEPRFATIRAAPIELGHATAAAGLTIAAATTLLWPSNQERCWTRDALTAGVLIPVAAYLLMRLIADLSGPAVQAWWGFTLSLAAGLVAVITGWSAASHPELDTALTGLMRRLAALAATGVGLALVARSADLPAAANYALQATCLTAIAASLAGTLASLSGHILGISAGTYRLSRLGGLVHTMPITSAALSAALFALAALPPSLGFGALWLLFQSILSAPRTGGLFSQLPLALLAALIALSAALATSASVRIAGIAILGRPRTPRAAAAAESKSPTRAILLALTCASFAAGLFPGPLLWLLATPAIHALAALPLGRHSDLTLLALSGASSGYLVLPILALVAFATGAVMLASNRARKQPKPLGPWTDGLQPAINLPFGDPAAQSAGAGFLPALPSFPIPRLPATIPAFPRLRLQARTGIWIILASFGVLLLALAFVQ